MRLCYLIGYPLGHSMSALMHNAAFEELGLDYRYELLPVKPEDLGRLVSSTLRLPEVRGANITIPHKVAVMEHLDWIDREASRIGAVNTIVNDEGRLRGYNTDGRGALRALNEAYGSLKGVKAVILGAGGAARAIGYQVSIYASKLTILNRTLERAVSLSRYLSNLPECQASVSASTLNEGDLKTALRDTDILVNATPVGMLPSVDETPVDGGLLRPELFVFDSVYNPLKTRLLREAEERGAETLSGVDMLVYQGAAAFRLWTGREAPEKLMRQSILERLGGGRR
jgi:shikimate dehydrogenase